MAEDTCEKSLSLQKRVSLKTMKGVLLIYVCIYICIFPQWAVGGERYGTV